MRFAKKEEFKAGIRSTLKDFWDDVLEIEATSSGVAVAMPVMLPDGLQVVIHLEQVAERQALLTDKGETLSRLVAEGMRVDSGKTGELLGGMLATHELSRDDYELRRSITMPPQGIDLQLFAESLVSIALALAGSAAEEPADCAGNGL